MVAETVENTRFELERECVESEIQMHRTEGEVEDQRHGIEEKGEDKCKNVTKKRMITHPRCSRALLKATDMRKMSESLEDWENPTGAKNIIPRARAKRSENRHLRQSLRIWKGFTASVRREAAKRAAAAEKETRGQGGEESEWPWCW
ncbi:hypothetical protein K438DRAFT_1757997 [Mycena galopus ATCC 62051]|nr:hypothetical protein K438DRAFT_1757997 [Mycena galopus ATCC 62051]